MGATTTHGSVVAVAFRGAALPETVKNCPRAALGAAGAYHRGLPATGSTTIEQGRIAATLKFFGLSSRG